MRDSAHAALEGIEVLALDDEPDARDLIRRILEESGAEVRTSGSAAEAFSMLEKFAPDVIVSDIAMPELDGYEFLSRVRTLHDNAKTPAIALTAFARSEAAHAPFARGSWLT